jgi:hypothetical protein
MPLRKWRGNTRRENRLEELGRVDAEKAYSKKGKRNLRDEKSRIRKELATGGPAATRPKRPSIDRKDIKIYLTDPEKRRKAGPAGPARPVPKYLRDKLKELHKRRKAGPSAPPRSRQQDEQPSPGRPGGRGPKPDKRWRKGPKYMTPLGQMVKTGKPKIAKKGWK